jgi:hypothetical protein
MIADLGLIFMGFIAGFWVSQILKQASILSIFEPTRENLKDN